MTEEYGFASRADEARFESIVPYVRSTLSFMSQEHIEKVIAALRRALIIYGHEVWYIDGRGATEYNGFGGFTPYSNQFCITPLRCINATPGFKLDDRTIIVLVGFYDVTLDKNTKAIQLLPGSNVYPIWSTERMQLFNESVFSFPDPVTIGPEDCIELRVWDWSRMPCGRERGLLGFVIRPLALAMTWDDRLNGPLFPPLRE